MRSGASGDSGRQPALWIGPWLTRSAVVVGAGILVLALWALLARSATVFWPAPVTEWVVETDGGDSRRLFAQQVGRAENVRTDSRGQADSRRYLLRTIDVDGIEHGWVEAQRILRRSQPRHLLAVTTADGSQVYGYAHGIETFAVGQDGAVVPTAVAASAHLVLTVADRSERKIPLLDIVDLEYPNQRSVLARGRLAGSALLEFVSGTGTGAGAALRGTALLALLLLAMLLPPGVLCALYLHYYGRGPAAAAVRVALTSLAAVPSVVIGVFVLGAVVYAPGLRFAAWPAETQALVPAAGGVFWAALTLAIVSLPVMIAATETGLGTVGKTERRCAAALGASRNQIMRSLVLPRAWPGIAAGALLAAARSAGAVAPLLVVGGAVQGAGSAASFDGPLGGTPIAHLGLRVYELAVQSRQTDAVVAQACATALLLLLVVGVLNWAGLRCLRRLPGGVAP